jgi:hypothetical protein
MKPFPDKATMVDDLLKFSRSLQALTCSQVRFTVQDCEETSSARVDKSWSVLGRFFR